jgi:AcrR family transcriptional regulator
VSRPLPTQERSRLRVESILEATHRLLAGGGVEACSVAAIAAEAGITPASLYRYFADSSAVLHALAEAMLEKTHTQLRDAMGLIQSAADIEPVMKRAVDSYISSFREDRALRELWFGTMSDPSLIALNVADSRRNGDLIASAIAPFSEHPLPVLRARGFLVAHTVGSAVGLMLDVEPKEQARLRIELHRVLLMTLIG